MATIHLDTGSVDSYRTFLAVKSLPVYSIKGHVATFPDEYAERLGLTATAHVTAEYSPHSQLFDYQRDISALAIEKHKFAVFADPGLGKTLIMFEWARHALDRLPDNRCLLIVAPPMVVNQHIAELTKFYGDEMPMRRVLAAELQEWLASGTERLGITNYEALKDSIKPGRLGALALDESSMLKSHYGKWGTRCIELGKGLKWKLALTGTPAPNDQIEYGNHAVFLDQFPNVNAFLAKYFVNRGQTQNRWELKKHALGPFYRALSHWCIFLSNPATYGWKDNCGTIPPIYTHIENVDLTKEQEAIVQKKTGGLFAHKIGGIASRGALGQIAKGHYQGVDIPTNKPEWIKQRLKDFGDESTLIWCLYNAEQDKLASIVNECANIDGKTPFWRRLELIDEFKSCRCKVLISKPKILGFGLNLQVATRQIFSGLQDSYESYFQAVKRSNRVGSTRPLNVHIPVTDIEIPMVETVLKKAARVQQDTQVQEAMFKDASR